MGSYENNAEPKWNPQYLTRLHIYPNEEEGSQRPKPKKSQIYFCRWVADYTWRNIKDNEKTEHMTWGFNEELSLPTSNEATFSPSDKTVETFDKKQNFENEITKQNLENAHTNQKLENALVNQNHTDNNGGQNLIDVQTKEEEEPNSYIPPSYTNTKGQEKEPFFYCRLVATCPRFIFYICLCLNLSLLVMTGLLISVGYNLVPLYFADVPMELFNIPYRLREMAIIRKDDYPGYVHRLLTKSTGYTRERGMMSVDGSVSIVYDTNGGNIFTKSNLLKIKEIEEGLMLTEQYQENWCLTHNESLACNKPLSVLRFFDGGLSKINPALNDPDFKNISGVLFEAYNHPLTKKDILYFLPEKFTLTPTKIEGDITRSILTVGCSRTGEKNCSEIKNNIPAKEFASGPLNRKLNILRNTPYDFEIYYFSYIIFRTQITLAVKQDLLLAVGSLLFIFAFMVFHTRSLWLTFFAVLSILSSFLGVNMIYRCVLDFQYFGVFHVLAIFIILGIGADDLFVFYDSWRLTAFRTYPSLAHRLSDSYSKSARSMFITSLTTMVAFMCSAISPFLGTKSFGVFAGSLVLYNYMSVIVFFPAVVVLYHQKFESSTWPCFRPCIKNNDSNQKRNNETPFKELIQSEECKNVASVRESAASVGNCYAKHKDEFKDFGNYDKCNYNAARQKNNDLSKELRNCEKELNYSTKDKNSMDNHFKEYSPTVQKKRTRESKLVVFFRDYYFKFVTHKLSQKMLLPLFTTLVVFLAYEASSLEPPNEYPQMYKDHHFFTKALKADAGKFVSSPSGSLVKVSIVWGLKENDRSHCHFSSISCFGRSVYDETFDPNPVVNQQALVDFCESFDKMSSAELSEYRIKKDPVTHEVEVDCFTKPLNRFLTDLGSQVGVDITLPWNYTHIDVFTAVQPFYYDYDKFNSSFPNILEIPVQYWMYNGFGAEVTDNFRKYDELIGEEEGPWSQPLKSYPAIKYGNKLKYITITVHTSINRFTTGYSEVIPIIEKWEALIKSKMAKMPEGLKGGFQVSRAHWHYYYIQKELVQNALLGIVVGISMSFFILSLTTMNIVIGFFATLSISCTTVSVVGMIPLLGWKLGILPSLNMCIVVGLAVDYVVHLAEGYHLSPHKDRLNRTRDMLEDMGPSIFSGACTTLGASVFMLCAEMRFFIQFGVFLFCTVGFSLLFSLGMFTVLMGSIGPENDIGSLRVLFNKCTCFINKQKSNAKE